MKLNINEFVIDNKIQWKQVRATLIKEYNSSEELDTAQKQILISKVDDHIERLKKVYYSARRNKKPILTLTIKIKEMLDEYD